jgi:hypothetical protein
MFVAERGRVATKPARQQGAPVVLRYFVAVLLLPGVRRDRSNRTVNLGRKLGRGVRTENLARSIPM